MTNGPFKNKLKIKKMKTLFIVILCCSAFDLYAQTEKTLSAQPDKNKKILIVEAACGECRLGLKGTSCDLAVRINGKSYFVDGTDIDSHGDAHAETGFCNSIRKARVQGEIINDRFKASYFQLLPLPAQKERSDTGSNK
jgi:hypothetical protein